MPRAKPSLPGNAQTGAPPYQISDDVKILFGRIRIDSTMRETADLAGIKGKTGEQIGEQSENDTVLNY